MKKIMFSSFFYITMNMVMKMIDIFTQIKNNKDLSHNEKIVGKFILENPEQFLKMNVKEMSEKCLVSSSAIYRLCEKLNLSGFSDLKVKVSASYNQYIQTGDFDFDYPIRQHQTHYEIIHKIKEDYDKTLNSTAGLFSLEQLKKITSAMHKAKVIDIYTSAGNVYFAQNFQFQMKEIGVQVNVPIEDYDQRLTAASSDSTHFSIIISFGGRSVLTASIPQILKARKSPILLIGSQDYISQVDYHDYYLYMSAYENHYHKISSFSTRQSLLYILDVLYTCYFEVNYEDNVKKKLAYYEYIGGSTSELFNQDK